MPASRRRRDFAAAPEKNVKTVVSLERRVVSTHASPVPDKVFKVDLETRLYTGYKEFTPRSVILRPDQFMERRVTDVLPAGTAEGIDRAIHAAKEGKPVVFDCAVFGHWATVWTIAHNGSAYLNCTVRRRA